MTNWTNGRRVSPGHLHNWYYWLTHVLEDSQPHWWLRNCDLTVIHFFDQWNIYQLTYQSWWGCEEKDSLIVLSVIWKGVTTETRLAEPEAHEQGLMYKVVRCGMHSSEDVYALLTARKSLQYISEREKWRPPAFPFWEGKSRPKVNNYTRCN